LSKVKALERPSTHRPASKERMMKHALIIAHPNPESFNLAMARAYQAAAEAIGDTVAVRDLYRIGFDPRLQASELPGPHGAAPAADVAAERVLIGDARVFAFVYPLWFYAPPAMLKGYLDRVFGMGFGYGAAGGASQPLLTGRMMISISSSGAPQAWIRQSGDWEAMRKLFDQHFAGVCGLAVVDHLHFGGIIPGITAEAVQDCAGQVAAAVKRHFAPAA
jgi:NAD(P)H dehydrogenase (quinone)